MTASKDQTSLTFYRLMRACQIAEQRFRQAAEIVTDIGTKRLLTLYSQQRTRFALELKREFSTLQVVPIVQDLEVEAISETEDFDFDSANQSVLQLCATTDQKSLEEYERALQEPIPRKAHFLIASQYALMRQVYSRISSLSSKTENKPKVELERSFA